MEIRWLCSVLRDIVGLITTIIQKGRVIFKGFGPQASVVIADS